MPSNRRQVRRLVWDRAFALSLTLTLVGLLMPFEVTPVAAAVGTLAVDTTADDPAATACTDAPDDCSLRGALINANADGRGGRDVVVPAGTFVLTVPGGGGERFSQRPRERRHRGRRLQPDDHRRQLPRPGRAIQHVLRTRDRRSSTSAASRS
jgi:hypothetical protein